MVAQERGLPLGQPDTLGQSGTAGAARKLTFPNNSILIITLKERKAERNICSCVLNSSRLQHFPSLHPGFNQKHLHLLTGFLCLPSTKPKMPSSLVRILSISCQKMFLPTKCLHFRMQLTYLHRVVLDSANHLGRDPKHQSLRWEPAKMAASVSWLERPKCLELFPSKETRD